MSLPKDKLKKTTKLTMQKENLAEFVQELEEFENQPAFSEAADGELLVPDETTGYQNYISQSSPNKLIDIAPATPDSDVSGAESQTSSVLLEVKTEKKFNKTEFCDQPNFFFYF